MQGATLSYLACSVLSTVTLVEPSDLMVSTFDTSTLENKHA